MINYLVVSSSFVFMEPTLTIELIFLIRCTDL